jgi:hypothetical protein
MAKLAKLGVVITSIVAAMTLSACAGTQRGDESAGALPADGTWTGVYMARDWGYLHLVQQGDRVTGTWRTGLADAWGEVNGEARGDVLHFTWTRRRTGIGPDGARTTELPTSGSAFVRYVAPAPGKPHQLKGEWQGGPGERGADFVAVKQMGTPANPELILKQVGFMLSGRDKNGASGEEGGTGVASMGGDPED